jgi:uncharacterized protein (DUF1330 family)
MEVFGMKVENALYPSSNRIMALASDASTQPIAMVNLLKFRDKASYKDGRPADISGLEAYLRYAREMRKIVERAGGRFLFTGRVNGLVVGDVDELWDVVAVVEYPSSVEFRRLIMSPEVQAIGVHREAGLAGQLLILTSGVGI